MAGAGRAAQPVDATLGGGGAGGGGAGGGGAGVAALEQEIRGLHAKTDGLQQSLAEILRRLPAQRTG